MVSINDRGGIVDECEYAPVYVLMAEAFNCGEYAINRNFKPVEFDQFRYVAKGG